MLDLAAVTACFNLHQSAARSVAYRLFEAGMRVNGITLYGVSLEVPPASIWQKERLLNLAIRNLPADVDKVIWIDGDVLVDSPTWAADVSAALDRWPIIQPWESAIFENANGGFCDGPLGHTLIRSVPAVNENNNESTGLPANAWPGFCWAARREVLDEIGGLYEMDLSGPNDVLMSLAFYGDFDNFFLLRYNGRFKDHYMPWAERAYKIVQGNVGYVPATLTHLWHGPFDGRRYLERTVRLYQSGYDPARDVGTALDGTLVLTDACPPDVRRLAEGIVLLQNPTKEQHA